MIESENIIVTFDSNFNKTFGNVVFYNDPSNIYADDLDYIFDEDSRIVEFSFRKKPALTRFHVFYKNIDSGKSGKALTIDIGPSFALDNIQDVIDDNTGSYPNAKHSQKIVRVKLENENIYVLPNPKVRHSVEEQTITLAESYRSSSEKNNYITKSSYENYIRDINEGYYLDKLGQIKIDDRKEYKIYKSFIFYSKTLTPKQNNNYYILENDSTKGKTYTFFGECVYDLYDSEKNLIGSDLKEYTRNFQFEKSSGKFPGQLIIKNPNPDVGEDQSYRENIFANLCYLDLDENICTLKSSNFITLEKYELTSITSVEGSETYVEKGFPLYIVGSKAGDYVKFRVDLPRGVVGENVTDSVLSKNSQQIDDEVDKYFKLYYTSRAGDNYITIKAVAKLDNDERENAWRPYDFRILPILNTISITISGTVVKINFFLVQRSSALDIIPYSYMGDGTLYPLTKIKTNNESYYELDIDREPTNDLFRTKRIRLVRTTVDAPDEAWIISDDQENYNDASEREYFFTSYYGNSLSEEIELTTQVRKEGFLNPDRFTVKTLAADTTDWRVAVYQSTCRIGPKVKNASISCGRFYRVVESGTIYTYSDTRNRLYIFEKNGQPLFTNDEKHNFKIVTKDRFDSTYSGGSSISSIKLQLGESITVVQASNIRNADVNDRRFPLITKQVTSGDETETQSLLICELGIETGFIGESTVENLLVKLYLNNDIATFEDGINLIGGSIKLTLEYDSSTENQESNIEFIETFYCATLLDSPLELLDSNVRYLRWTSPEIYVRPEKINTSYEPLIYNVFSGKTVSDYTNWNFIAGSSRQFDFSIINTDSTDKITNTTSQFNSSYQNLNLLCKNDLANNDSIYLYRTTLNGTVDWRYYIYNRKPTKYTFYHKGQSDKISVLTSEGGEVLSNLTIDKVGIYRFYVHVEGDSESGNNNFLQIKRSDATQSSIGLYIKNNGSSVAESPWENESLDPTSSNLPNTLNNDWAQLLTDTFISLSGYGGEEGTSFIIDLVYTGQLNSVGGTTTQLNFKYGVQETSIAIQINPGKALTGNDITLNYNVEDYPGNEEVLSGGAGVNWKNNIFIFPNTNGKYGEAIIEKRGNVFDYLISIPESSYISSRNEVKIGYPSPDNIEVDQNQYINGSFIKHKVVLSVKGTALSGNSNFSNNHYYWANNGIKLTTPGNPNTDDNGVQFRYFIIDHSLNANSFRISDEVGNYYLSSNDANDQATFSREVNSPTLPTLLGFRKDGFKIEINSRALSIPIFITLDPNEHLEYGESSNIQITLEELIIDGIDTWNSQGFQVNNLFEILAKSEDITASTLAAFNEITFKVKEGQFENSRKLISNLADYIFEHGDDFDIEDNIYLKSSIPAAVFQLKGYVSPARIWRLTGRAVNSIEPDSYVKFCNLCKLILNNVVGVGGDDNSLTTGCFYLGFGPDYSVKVNNPEFLPANIKTDDLENNKVEVEIPTKLMKDGKNKLIVWARSLVENEYSTSILQRERRYKFIRECTWENMSNSSDRGDFSRNFDNDADAETEDGVVPEMWVASLNSSAVCKVTIRFNSIEESLNFLDENAVKDYWTRSELSNTDNNKTFGNSGNNNENSLPIFPYPLKNELDNGIHKRDTFPRLRLKEDDLYYVKKKESVNRNLPGNEENISKIEVSYISGLNEKYLACIVGKEFEILLLLEKEDDEFEKKLYREGSTEFWWESDDTSTLPQIISPSSGINLYQEGYRYGVLVLAPHNKFVFESAWGAEYAPSVDPPNNTTPVNGGQINDQVTPREEYSGNIPQNSQYNVGGTTSNSSDPVSGETGGTATTGGTTPSGEYSGTTGGNSSGGGGSSSGGTVVGPGNDPIDGGQTQLAKRFSFYYTDHVESLDYYISEGGYNSEFTHDRQNPVGPNCLNAELFIGQPSELNYLKVEGNDDFVIYDNLSEVVVKKYKWCNHNGIDLKARYISTVEKRFWWIKHDDWDENLSPFQYFKGRASEADEYSIPIYLFAISTNDFLDYSNKEGREIIRRKLSNVRDSSLNGYGFYDQNGSYNYYGEANDLIFPNKNPNNFKLKLDEFNQDSEEFCSQNFIGTRTRERNINDDYCRGVDYKYDCDYLLTRVTKDKEAISNYYYLDYAPPTLSYALFKGNISIKDLEEVFNSEFSETYSDTDFFKLFRKLHHYPYLTAVTEKSLGTNLLFDTATYRDVYQSTYLISRPEQHPGDYIDGDFHSLQENDPSKHTRLFQVDNNTYTYSLSSTEGIYTINPESTSETAFYNTIYKQFILRTSFANSGTNDYYQGTEEYIDRGYPEKEYDIVKKTWKWTGAWQKGIRFYGKDMNLYGHIQKFSDLEGLSGNDNPFTGIPSNEQWNTIKTYIKERQEETSNQIKVFHSLGRHEFYKLINCLDHLIQNSDSLGLNARYIQIEENTTITLSVLLKTIKHNIHWIEDSMNMETFSGFYGLNFDWDVLGLLTYTTQIPIGDFGLEVVLQNGDELLNYESGNNMDEVPYIVTENLVKGPLKDYYTLVPVSP